MTISEIITLWSDNRGLSLLIWTILLVTAMYLARSSAHQSIAAAARALRVALRMTAARVLARVGDRRALEPLAACAEDFYRVVRQACRAARVALKKGRK